MEFVDDARKQANILVNDHWLYMDIRDTQVVYDISDHVEESNVIKIEPTLESIDIKELRVRIRKK